MKTDPLTNEELERYVNGDMSPEEMYQAELKMAGNPIYDDAIEGFKASGAGLAGFAALQSQFETSIGASSASSATGAAGSSAFGQVMGLCFGVAFTTVIGLGVAHESVQEQTNDSESNHQIALNETHDEVSEETLIAYDEVIEEDVLIEAIEIELKDADPVAENKAITYEKALKNQPTTLVDDVVEDVAEVPEPTPVSPVEIDPVEGVKFDKTVEVHSNVQIVYLHELKTVDLSKLYKRSIKIRNIHALSGTPAHSEIKLDDGETMNHLKPYIYIPYQKYLNDAMAKFEANNFKSALKDYKVILSHYKDDINAHFYGALCYYNLGKPTKAIDYFDAVLDDQINSFDQEAEFYKALCLIEAGHKQEASRLLEKIENDGLFYAKRARAERMAL